jgi:hypothetical protein
MPKEKRPMVNWNGSNPTTILAGIAAFVAVVVLVVGVTFISKPSMFHSINDFWPEKSE